MDKSNKKIIWLGLIISLFFVLIFFLTKDIGQKENFNIVSTTSTQTEKINQVFLEIDGKKLETIITKEESIYDFMLKLQDEGKIKFKEETYPGMGKLIKEINGIENSGEKNWIYYVNGEKAKIGVSNYKIIPGDVVSWKYEKDIN